MSNLRRQRTQKSSLENEQQNSSTTAQRNNEHNSIITIARCKAKARWTPSMNLLGLSRPCPTCRTLLERMVSRQWCWRQMELCLPLPLSKATIDSVSVAPNSLVSSLVLASNPMRCAFSLLSSLSLSLTDNNRCDSRQELSKP